MSLTAQRSKDPGPLRLHYDATPRDPMMNIGQAAQQSPRDFRYHGYPEGSFQTPRVPITGPSERGPFSEFSKASEKHPLRHQFDPGNPKAFGAPQGLQYGSEQFPGNAAKAQPIRGSLLNRGDENDFPKSDAAHRDIIQQYKEEMKKKKQERHDEKKQDWEMLKNGPVWWGKPGGGAPINKADNRKQKFTETDLHHVYTTTELTPRQKEFHEEYGDYNKNFGLPGAGAPLRTLSGNLKGQYKTAGELRFQATKTGQDIAAAEVRYKKEPYEKREYAKALDTQIKEKNLEAKERQIYELKKDIEMVQHDPYGRPGAGAPNRGTENERLTRSQPVDSEFEPYDPWGKGAVQPRRDGRGNTMRYKWAPQEGFVPTDKSRMLPPDDPEEHGKTIPLEYSKGGAGSPIRGDDGNIRIRLPTTLQQNERGDMTVREDWPGSSPRGPPHRMRHVHEELEIYDPFSKPGAGAPIRDHNGQVVSNVYGNFNDAATLTRKHQPPNKMPSEGQKQYLRELPSQRTTFPNPNFNPATQEGELAEVMNKGRVGKPRRDPQTGMMSQHHLGSSDVTKEQVGYLDFKQAGNPQSYHTELERAATERSRRAQLEKLKERQEARQHSDVMNEYWGRTGGGAPKGDELKKRNLDDIIYAPSKEAKYYNKMLPEGQQPYIYSKSTIKSTHGNLYENHDTKRHQNYLLPKPFATQRDDEL